MAENLIDFRWRKALTKKKSRKLIVEAARSHKIRGVFIFPVVLSIISSSTFVIVVEFLFLVCAAGLWSKSILRSAQL